MSERPSKHCHHLVAETAKAMTHELYAELMRDDVLRKKWLAKWPELSERRREQAFVNMYWAQAIPAAKATLANMLNGPLDTHLQAAIYDALIKDATLVRGRGMHVAPAAVEGPAPHGG